MFGNTNGRHSMHLVRWAAISIGTMIVLSYLVGFVHNHTASRPASAPGLATLPKAAAKPMAAAPALPARASTMALPAGPITLPAQPAPAGLARGHAQIAMASAQAPIAPWTSLGAAVVASPTASFQTIAPRALATVAPSAGMMRLRWRAWFDAPAAGSYTLAARLDGGPVSSLALRVDGVAAPVLTMARNCGLWGQCSPAPTTDAGSVALAAGWHQVQATITTYVGSKADVTFYMRAPGAAAPVVLVPSWPAGKAAAGAL